MYGNTKLAIMPTLPTLYVCEKLNCVTFLGTEPGREKRAVLATMWTLVEIAIKVFSLFG